MGCTDAPLGIPAVAAKSCSGASPIIHHLKSHKASPHLQIFHMFSVWSGGSRSASPHPLPLYRTTAVTCHAAAKQASCDAGIIQQPVDLWSLTEKLTVFAERFILASGSSSIQGGEKQRRRNLSVSPRDIQHNNSSRTNALIRRRSERSWMLRGLSSAHSMFSFLSVFSSVPMKRQERSSIETTSERIQNSTFGMSGDTEGTRFGAGGDEKGGGGGGGVGVNTGGDKGSAGIAKLKPARQIGTVNVAQQPFFLYVALMEPHTPHTPSLLRRRPREGEPVEVAMIPETVPTTLVPPFPTTSAVKREEAITTPSTMAGHLKLASTKGALAESTGTGPTYALAMRQADDVVGRLCAALNALDSRSGDSRRARHAKDGAGKIEGGIVTVCGGEHSNTLTVVTSDNGERANLSACWVASHSE
jgi:hypothetical protein